MRVFRDASVSLWFSENFISWHPISDPSCANCQHFQIKVAWLLFLLIYSHFPLWRPDPFLRQYSKPIVVETKNAQFFHFGERCELALKEPRHVT